ncbi:MAG: ABC transporter ATP-binding protein [Gammaproteobacteria bacterium]|nr:ABC transporter ATP-binding protein [Gammaproteobacteria bacterium]
MAIPLETRDLSVRVADRVLVSALTLALPPGALVALLGPNGVGKTLTLHSLCGLRPSARGCVSVGGKALLDLSPRETAQRIGLLLQDHEDPFPTSVLETALMGRHARLGLWQWETAEDEVAARAALAAMDLAGMEQRAAATLSGGERRRLGLATLLVQDPDVLLLDEPLNHLDPRHQFAVLGELRRLAANGKTIIASLHDPVLAARHFDHAVLLYGDGRWHQGPVGEVMTHATLAGLYAVPFERYRCEARDDDRVLLATPPP